MTKNKQKQSTETTGASTNDGFLRTTAQYLANGEVQRTTEAVECTCVAGTSCDSACCGGGNDGVRPDIECGRCDLDCIGCSVAPYSIHKQTD